MAIKIIEDGPDITVTRSEHERLQREYARACSFMVDPPSFDQWVRSNASFTKASGVAMDSDALLRARANAGY